MDLQQLITEATPGSIWMRTDGSRARVLAITNLSLPTESQQKYVPVVVYIGPSGKVFSRPLKDFAGYFPTWLGHDASAEKTIKSLLTPLNAPKPEVVSSDDDDSIDMSGDDPVAVPRAKPAVQVREKVEAKVAVTAPAQPIVPNLMRAAFQLGNDEARKTTSVTAEQLSRALRVYSQVPDEHLGLVVHKLSFELSPKLTIENLMEAFAPDDWVNTVDAFRIGTPVSDETVGVDAYIGVYPEFTRNVLYGTVYVGVDLIPVNNQSVQSHVHTSVTQPGTVVPDEVTPAAKVVETQPAEVPAENQVAQAEVAPEVQAEVETSSSLAPVQEGLPVVTGGVENPDAATTEVAVTASSEPAPDAQPVPVKVRKKRGPKKKIVEPAPASDDELDVDALS